LNTTQPNIRKYRRNTIIAAVFIVTIAHVGFSLYNEVSLPISIASWGITNLGAIVLIFIAYNKVHELYNSLQDQIDLYKKTSQRQIALAKLSTGLATSLSENEICDELVRRLNEIQGYEFIAIYILEEKTGDRILQANVGGLGLPDSTCLKPGSGLCEIPLHTATYQYTPDVSECERYVPGLGRGSEVDVPIKFGDDKFGVIVVENHNTNAFDTSDITMISAVADQGALAIQNTRLLNSEKERRREAELLRKATNAVSSDLDLNLVLNRILTKLAEVVPYNSACIFLWEGKALIAKAAHGLPKPDEVINKHFSSDDYLFQKVIEKKSATIINDLNLIDEFKGWGGTQDTRSWIGIPLMVDQEIIGILTLDHNKPNRYTQETVELSVIFANQAAVTIQNAQLYHNAKSSAEQLMVLHHASQQITSASFDPERTYTTIHEAARQLMPCEAFCISILDESKDEIDAAYLFDREGRTPGKRIPSSEGLSGHIIKTGKPLLVRDYLSTDKMSGIDEKHFGHPDHIRALIAVPMKLGTKIIGMLSAQTYTSYNYSEQEQQMLEMLAAHAAVAIDNSQLFAQVQHLAITDSLTGIYNRRYFFDTAQREFNRSARYDRCLSIMMLDLDNYKKINDLYGHHTGDLALIDFSRLLQNNVRETDVLGRYGGDEFSILLPETDYQEATEIADRLRILIRDTVINIDGKAFNSTISVGISTSNKTLTDFSQLLLSADKALYDAKKMGKDHICYCEWPFESSEEE